MDAETVVQVYIKAKDSPFAPLHPRLTGFARVAVKAGVEAEVTIPLDKHAFTVINDKGERVGGGCHYTLYTGFNQPDARSVALGGAAPMQCDITLPF